MPKRRIRASVRTLVNLADHVSGALLIAITILNLAAVFMRYVMLDSISWSEEVMRYASVWLTFLAAAAASFRNEHLSLELLRGIGSPVMQRFHDAALHLLAALFAAVVVWQGVIYCMKNGLQTAPTTGMLMGIAYSAMVVGGALILIAELTKAWDAVVPPGEDELAKDVAR